jgi:hypothetical protein
MSYENCNFEQIVKDFSRDSKDFIHNYVSLRDELAQANKIFKDDQVSFDKLRESFPDLDMNNLKIALEARQTKLSEDMSKMTKQKELFNVNLKVCKNVMQILLDVHSDLSSATDDVLIESENDKFVVEMSKLLYSNLIDNHQIRRDPLICGVEKLPRYNLLDNLDSNCVLPPITLDDVKIDVKDLKIKNTF